MVDDIDIEELPEERYAAIDEEALPAPIKSQRLVGYKTLGLAMIVAALLGAGGGGILSKFAAPSAPNLSPLKAQIDTAVSENKSLKAQLARLQQDIKKQGGKATAPKIDLSGIEARLTSLESSEPQITELPIDPDLVARLEALQNEGSDALDLSDILARLERLETDREALLMDLKSNLETDESFGVGKTVSLQSSSADLVVPDVLPTFPKAAILVALSEADQSSWLKRTLNKRITVQSEDNPRYLVKLIETDLEAGHISDALIKFDKLPQTAKSAAQDWRNAFKDTE